MKYPINRSYTAPGGQSAMHNMLLSTKNSSRSLSSESAVTRCCSHAGPLSAAAAVGDGTHCNANFASPSTTTIATTTDCSTVHLIVPHILKACHEAQYVSGNVPAPELECYQLAQWAKQDAFYRVVIAGNGGIQAIVRAMQSFPESEGLQECCCLALGNMCVGSSNNANSQTVQAMGGIRQIIAAMTVHATSVAVQSAACEALRTLSASIRLIQDSNTTVQLIHVLQRAKSMYLPNRSTAEQLLQVSVRSALMRRCVSEPPTSTNYSSH